MALPKIIDDIESRVKDTGDTLTGELISLTDNAFRFISKDIGTILRNDGDQTYFLLTNSGDEYGAWNNLRLVASISSRHGGNGIVSICFGHDSSIVDATTAYGEIAYFGNTTGGSIFNQDMLKLYYNASKNTFYLFWKYYDYNGTSITLLDTNSGVALSNFSNGAFVTSVDTAIYGNLICQTSKGWMQGDNINIPTGTDYTTQKARNIAANTSLSTPANGNIFLVYT